MKKIKYCLLLAFGLCWIGGEVWAQSQLSEEMQPELKELYISHKQKADFWKQKLQENPKDERAWINYATNANQAAIFSGRQPEEEKDKKKMYSRAESAIANTATCAVIKNILFPSESSSPAEVIKIMEKWPNETLHYPYYMMNLLLINDSERIKSLCRQWYRSGTFPQQCLNFSYNELAGTEKNTVIFWDGSYMDGISMLILQHGKGVFTDRTVVNFPLLLADSLYRKQLFTELELPEYKNDTVIGEEWKNIVVHVARHSKYPVYFPFYMQEFLLQNHYFKKEYLSCEGLLLKYSEETYDNLALLRRNFEHVYLLDYLRISFFPKNQDVPYIDSKWIEPLNLYYIPAFRSLLKFYKESGDRAHYEELYNLLRSIIDRSDYATPKVKEEYLNSINNL